MDARTLGDLVVDHATYTTESKYHALFQQLRQFRVARVERGIRLCQRVERALAADN